MFIVITYAAAFALLITNICENRRHTASLYVNRMYNQVARLIQLHSSVRSDKLPNNESRWKDCIRAQTESQRTMARILREISRYNRVASRVGLPNRRAMLRSHVNINYHSTSTHFPL